MYKPTRGQGTIFEDISVFSDIKLDPENRWVKMAALIPWDTLDAMYAKTFKGKDTGNPGKSSRMALGSLIIQTKLSISDVETRQMIMENPYLQWFVGLPYYSYEPPFDASTMVSFRKRITPEMIEMVNEAIIQGTVKKQETAEFLEDSDNQDSDGKDGDDKPNSGTLILDATCAPSDIAFPTDVSLLSKARELTETMIDELHSHRQAKKKPRTYRKVARQKYLRFARNRRPSRKLIRQAVKSQLGFVGRNLKHIETLLSEGLELSELSIQKLETVNKLYLQQLEMYENQVHSIPERIVSLDQPWVRPIVRGKSKARTEFGAKVAISLVDGFARIEKLSWDAFNEAGTFIESVERYYGIHGCYPERVLVDMIYRNSANRGYCKSKGILMSGRKLGRPPSDPEIRKQQNLEERAQAGQRNAVEGKFGEAKRCYGLDLLMARRQDTCESSIHMVFLVMNLAKRLRLFLLPSFRNLQFHAKNFFYTLMGSYGKKWKMARI